MSKTEDLPAQDALRTFSQLLGHLEEGQFHTECTEKFRDIVRDLNQGLLSERKTAASMTVTIKFTADRGVIETIGDVKVVQPKRVRSRSMLHVANGQFLSANHPNQLALPLRTVPIQDADLRTAN